eukprot:5950943-Pyramimonas_sp.AAC.1
MRKICVRAEVDPPVAADARGCVARGTPPAHRLPLMAGRRRRCADGGTAEVGVVAAVRPGPRGDPVYSGVGGQGQHALPEGLRKQLAHAPAKGPIGVKGVFKPRLANTHM